VEITAHARQRISERTLLQSKDVLLIIQNNLVEDLGVHNNVRYYCFYSSLEDKAKIALVSSDGMRLVSVWNIEFPLPAGIRRVTETVVWQAKLKLAKWSSKKRHTQLLNGTLRVQNGKKETIHEIPLNDVPFPIATQKTLLREHVASPLESIKDLLHKKIESEMINMDHISIEIVFKKNNADEWKFVFKPADKSGKYAIAI
jgi:hypothetical protein